MSSQPTTLSPFLKKLQLWSPLAKAEQDAILALPHKVEDVLANRYLVRQGDRATHCCLLVEGFAMRHKVLVDGARSISAIHMKGDVVDLQNSILGTADHSVQTLTRSKVAFIPREELRRIAFEHPAVGMAMWQDTLVDAAIFREWIANVARRDAAARVAHLLCEFGIKLEAIGIGDRLGYELPLTQEQLADATGLTSVHVNRTLMDLGERGFISRAKRRVAIANWDEMTQLAGFDDTYLHFQDESSLLP